MFMLTVIFTYLMDRITETSGKGGTQFKLTDPDFKKTKRKSTTNE